MHPHRRDHGATYGKEVNIIDIAGVCWHFVEIIVMTNSSLQSQARKIILQRPDYQKKNLWQRQGSGLQLIDHSFCSAWHQLCVNGPSPCYCTRVPDYKLEWLEECRPMEDLWILISARGSSPCRLPLSLPVKKLLIQEKTAGTGEIISWRCWIELRAKGAM